MRDSETAKKLRVSFDLDEVLFVSPQTHRTEPSLPFPLNRIFRERLRLGTPALIRSLQASGCDVWIYTSSARTERYIRTLFRLYGVKLDGIVNAQRHNREVQRDRKEVLPQKMPNRYRISLHVDDEAVICAWGREYGFNTYLLNAQDDEWKEKILRTVETIRKKGHPDSFVSDAGSDEKNERDLLQTGASARYNELSMKRQG